MNQLLSLSKPVKQALNDNRPVIALESTIISHGMPYPQNVQVAKELEEIARAQGVEPATICLMDGKIKIGLSDQELELLANSNNVAKVSRRNFSQILAEKRIGATTVAATMMAAHMANISVFATGGIGGVHRGHHQRLDISADLLEFARTPVTVISAGIKAILDLPNTIEYLETQGVPVYGYQTNRLPAFYSSSSDIPITKVDNAQQIFNIFKMDRELGNTNGILVANPIPKEFEIPFEQMEKQIQIALEDAKRDKIEGAQITPYLLAKLVTLTGGNSLDTNIELVKNNVRVGCQIALAYKQS